MMSTFKSRLESVFLIRLRSHIEYEQYLHFVKHLIELFVFCKMSGNSSFQVLNLTGALTFTKYQQTDMEGHRVAIM